MLTWLGMLAAIGFDDEESFKAGKVHDEWRDRMLTSKTPTQAAASEPFPQEALGIGH